LGKDCKIQTIRLGLGIPWRPKRKTAIPYLQMHVTIGFCTPWPVDRGPPVGRIDGVPCEGTCNQREESEGEVEAIKGEFSPASGRYPGGRIWWIQ
jgi:hypothetical protein